MGVFDSLGQIVQGSGPLQDIWNQFLASSNERAAHEANLLQDQLSARQQAMGLLDSPAGQKVIANAMAEQGAARDAAYSQQAGQWGLGLSQLVSQLQEAQRTRDFEASQNELNRQQQLRALQAQQVDNPLAYQRGMIPISTDAFRASTNVYRQMYPDWNKDPTAEYFKQWLNNMNGGGGGMGSISGGISDSGLPERKATDRTMIGYDNSGDRAFADAWNAQTAANAQANYQNATSNAKSMYADYRG